MKFRTPLYSAIVLRLRSDVQIVHYLAGRVTPNRGFKGKTLFDVVYLRNDTRWTRAYYRPVRRHSSADEMGERYRLNHAIDRCKLHNPYTQFTRNVRLPC